MAQATKRPIDPEADPPHNVLPAPGSHDPVSEILTVVAPVARAERVPRSR
jgi:hypothetical protein